MNTAANAATASIRRSPGDSQSGTTYSLRALEGAILQCQAARKAPPEVKGDGVLQPGLIVGLGSLGMGVLQRLRESLCRRFGSLSQAPHLRLLLIDTDAEVVRTATRGASGAALSAADVLITPLNRPSHYVKPREGRPPLESWLNPRMLYRIPRSQVTTGVRALGRLAYLDNFRAIARRLQIDLDACLDPAALPAAARQSGLEVRSNRPRVYVVAGLSGGTGSGAFLDLTYTVRALLKQMGYEQPELVGLLLLPPVDRNRTRVMALGNAYAALTELIHYATPGSTFTARYHEREAPIQDHDPPFGRCVLLPLPDETDEVATRETVENAAQYLYSDLCTPLGRTADLGRAGLSAPPWASRGLYYQTFGLYQLAWPRHALLAATARQLCLRLVTRWISKDSKPIRDAVQEWVQEQWAARQLGPEHLIEQLREACDQALGRPVEEAFTAVLAPLQARSEGVVFRKASGPDVTPPEAAAALAEIERLLPKPQDDGMADSTATLVQELRSASERMVNVWSQRLAEMSVRLIEEPAFRLAGAEEAVRQAVASIEQILQRQEPLARDLSTRAGEAYARLQLMVGPPRPGVRRPSFSAADCVESMRSFAKWRFQSLVLLQASAAFVALRGHLNDELREINFCRVRLAELQRLLEEAPAETSEASLRNPTGRSLFPFEGRNLEDAVEKFMARFKIDDYIELDARLQELFNKEFTALVNICLSNSPQMIKIVEAAMVRTARQFADERLGRTDAAEMFLGKTADDESARGELATLYDEARPELAAVRGVGGAEVCVVAAPASADGERLRNLAAKALPDAELLPAVSDGDVLVYREVANLSLADLEQLGPLGQDAYRQMSAADNFTPHTRTDVSFKPPKGF
jgi:hypothetical protein